MSGLSVTVLFTWLRVGVKTKSKVCRVRLKVRKVRAREWCQLSRDTAEL